MMAAIPYSALLLVLGVEFVLDKLGGVKQADGHIFYLEKSNNRAIEA